MTARSNRMEVRNPIAAMPEVQEAMAEFSVAERRKIAKILRALSKHWKVAAQKSWDSSKAPMAAYHKANSVNARHLALALEQVER